MPAPSNSLATLRPDLGGSMEEFDLIADRMGFIANRVLPVIEADRPSGTFGKIPIEELLKSPDVVRNSRSGYPRGKWTFTDDSYATKEYGFEEPVDERDSKFYADYFDAELVAAQLALDTVLRAHEKRAADLLFNISTWTPTSVTHEWDDYENATPINDVEASVQRVYDASGLWPNALIINRKVFRNLRQCEQVIERIQAAGAGDRVKASDITADMLAAVFDLEEVIVAGASKNNAKEGQTAEPVQIWSSEYAMVARVARTSNIKEPCLGRTIHWGADGSQIGGTMESYRDETVRGDVIRCRHEVHQKVFMVELADLMDNITT